MRKFYEKKSLLNTKILKKKKKKKRFLWLTVFNVSKQKIVRGKKENWNPTFG